VSFSVEAHPPAILDHMQDVSSGLASTSTFVDAAVLVCEHARGLGVAHASVRLQRSSGRSALVVETGDLDPELEANGHRIGAPLVGVDGRCGALAFVQLRSFEQASERELVGLALELSAWCTVHGVGSLPDRADAALLGPRQHRIAQLAADGLTNAEIATVLKISINTVKTRLKEVFERLAIESRSQLLSVLRRVAPVMGVAIGVNPLSGVTIVCEAPISRPHGA
jgi:DNA-binding CsgD family transcriptional regulator